MFHLKSCSDNLPSIVSSRGIDIEINRLAKTNSSFGRLYKKVEQQELKKQNKDPHLQGCSHHRSLRLWDLGHLYHGHIRLLERFHQRCQRTILNIHWSDFITNVEVLEQAEIPSFEATILKHQLRWAGHVSRMGDHRLSKIVMFGERRECSGGTKRQAIDEEDPRRLHNHTGDHLPCRHCQRICLSRIGLVSHERVCSRRQRGQPS